MSVVVGTLKVSFEEHFEILMKGQEKDKSMSAGPSER